MEADIMRNIRLRTSAAMLAAFLFAWSLNTACEITRGVYTDVVCVFLGFAWAVCAVWALTSERKTDRTSENLLLSASFLAGLIFVLQLPHLFSWHDLASYSADFSAANKPDGHLGFIAWMVENNRLPLDLNPMDEGFSVFYNPPLHHIFHALFMKLNLLLGIPEAIALENLQLVTLMFAFGTVFAAVQLMRELGMNASAVRTGLWFIAFQPALLILGTTLNNDIQMIFFVVLCMVHVVRWQKKRRTADILLIALFLGCGMATKLNAALLIPCIAPVFAVAFFKAARARRMGYIGQFALFLLISVPIAVAWPVYHMIAFDMPLNYVRLPSETINVSAYTLAQRYGIPDWHARRGLFYTPTRSISHNVWMQTLTTGLFDEMTLYPDGSVMWYVSYLLLMAFAGALVTGALGLLAHIWKRRDASGWFLLGYGALLLLSYLKFTLDYPYICTFNFRYIAPVLVLGAVGFARWRQKRKRTGWLAEAYAAGFSALTIFVYGIYFFG